jgi:hypothetical protein
MAFFPAGIGKRFVHAGLKGDKCQKVYLHLVAWKVYPHLVAWKGVGEDTKRSYSARQREISQNASKTKMKFPLFSCELCDLCLRLLDWRGRA